MATPGNGGIAASPFFHPADHAKVTVQKSPGGTRRRVVSEPPDVKEKKSGLLGATANLMNAIVGSGIVGIPYAIREAGFCAGIFLVLLCALITEKSLRLLIATAKHVHCPTYETAMESAYGVFGFRFITVNMFIMAYGALLSYLMVVKDCFSTLFGVDPDDEPSKRAVLVVVSLAIMVPISSQRDVASLAWTSRLNVFIDTALVILIAISAPISERITELGGWTELFQDSVHFDTIFVGLGVLSFAFVCQHSAFLIAGSLENPTVSRWSTVTRMALIACAILALLSGISGYAGFLDETKGNILNNLDPDSITANTARALLGLTMLFVYPLESFVARHVLVVLFFSGRRAHEGDDSTILNRRDRRIGLTMFLYLFAVMPAAIFHDLGTVLAVTGAIGGSSLSYIGPGMLFLGVHGERFLHLVDKSWLSPMRQEKQSTQISEANENSRETTPLVAGKRPTVVPGITDGAAASAKEEESFCITLTRRVCWYLLGMPVWCRMAELGQARLNVHIRELTLKSPHPIRIGDVEYKRKVIETPKQVPRILSSPHLISSKGKAHSIAAGSTTIERSPIGRPPLVTVGGQPRSPTKQGSQPEPDPQERPPSWLDFVIAFFYIIFGIIALVVGLLSLYYTESD